MATNEKQKERFREFFDRPIVDSKRTIPIEVTKGDIARAQRKSCETCAVANAVIRELKPADAMIFRTRTYIKPKKGQPLAGKIVRFLITPHTQEAIIEYDQGKGMDPGTHRLVSPHRTARLGRRQGSKSFNRKYRKRQSPIHTKGIRREAPRGHVMNAL